MKKYIKPVVLTVLILSSTFSFLFLQLELNRLTAEDKEALWSYEKYNSGAEINPNQDDEEESNILSDIAFLILLIKKGLEGIPVL